MIDEGLGPRLLTVREAAGILRISVGGMYRLASRRAVVSYKYAGMGLRFKPSDLEKFVLKGKRTRRDAPAIVSSKN